ncbi:uncharacterized protein AMSG_08619 [Thecamonas trahens ATCC 50062]|uniref:RUN domain-containing protein n=1 Tax=Thecamonas trahens ATCC 50062 TaxID=461836 RepID=A0A0L0DKJ4_THETB|nr:hypothetical protein AMSG_08619 [Thecamonas trahens ATCC 50062]KNC52740.1 hypothetical protein AMSG_08619 [Thecamonas trahens ATCC 50062]|eukprot:XP_013755054.1 hypothetical protein AMSG_08619 [Thecamonas trahens ATCC 50062]
MADRAQAGEDLVRAVEDAGQAVTAAAEGGGGVVDEGAVCLVALCRAVEALLRHGLRARGSFFGGAKDYIHFVAAAARDAPAAATTLRSEAATFGVSTPAGRGRAFLRAALAEQALAPHLAALTSDVWTVSEWYEAHAALRSPTLRTRALTALDGLTPIVFALCVKDVDLDATWAPPAAAGSAATSSPPRRTHVDALSNTPLPPPLPQPVASETGQPQQQQVVELVPLGRFAQREYRKAWLAALSAATEAWYRANEADDAAQTAANVAAELQAEVLALASSATAAEARAAQAGVERDAAETRAAELERALEAEERVTSQITLEYNAKLKALAASEAENFELKLTLVALGKQLRDAGLVPCVETGNDGDETVRQKQASTMTTT